MNNNKTNEYGHWLDKYLDEAHIDMETKIQRKEEGENRYGHWLDKAKPDCSILNLMVKIEDNRIERIKREEEEERLAAIRRQERIQAEKQKLDELLFSVLSSSEIKFFRQINQCPCLK